MRRFYLNIESLDEQLLTLTEEESKHAVRVLRMKIGDQAEIVNGHGDLFVGEIIDASPKRMTLQQKSFIKVPKDKYHIHIAIAPTKSNDRIEWFLEKATELGIHEVTPILCDNSERKKIKLERYEKILVAAMKQSKRLYLPVLNEFTKFNDFIEKHPNGYLAHCYEDESLNTTILAELKKDASPWVKSNTPVLIGPEGDFSIKEVKKATESGYQSLTLGSTRLRTETAGVYACTNFKLFFEEIYE